jgi:hypothetical protein
VLWIFLCFLLLNNPVFADFESTPSASVIINKFQYNPPLDKNEWVELYNLTDGEVDLNNWMLVDESNTKKLLTGKKIGAKNFLVFDDGKSWLNNTASNNDGDTIFLKIGDSIVDSVDYKRTSGQILVKGQQVSADDLILKGKWIGRIDVGSTNWQVYADTEGPIGGAINYFDGYKTILEMINIGITPASDVSGIGTTEIKIRESILENNNCIGFNYLNIGSSLGDGKCYKFEYVASDGVGNSSVFSSNSTVKFDTTKPLFSFDSAFRNILKLKTVFGGVDHESGILKYKYSLDNLNCGSSIVPVNWSYIYNSILNIGYSGNQLAIYGKTINNAMLESDVDCIDFVIDIIAPKIIDQITPEKKKYKIGDKLKFNFEFDENIDTVGNNFEIQLNTGNAEFIDKTDNILNFEYVVKTNDLIFNLNVGETWIILNGGQITDTAGNDVDLTINNLEPGIEIDGVIPQISLVGETYVEVAQFDSYLELGATASDIPDGDLTNSISIDNDVDTNLGGYYEVIYQLSDSAGNENEIVRKIKVIDATAPVINQLSIINLELLIKSNEDGYLEWMGKCSGENNNLVTGNNIIKIKNVGDGVYDNCEIRAWDKWGNVGEWQVIDSFEVDSTPPIISFINSSLTDISVSANENLKSCVAEKLMSGDFETGNTDGWDGEWVADDMHFVLGAWSAKSPNLVNEDLIEKSISQKINLESDGILSFWWRVSSEKDWDFLKLYIDGILINKISGEVSWQEQKYNLNMGTHTIKFTYSKDYSGEGGEDAGWIDEVKIDGGGNITSMDILNNYASTKLSNLTAGSTKYKITCTDLHDNQSIPLEKRIIKNMEDNNDNLPTPTPYTIFKTTAIVPTIKTTKPTVTKTPVKKTSSVLGVATTPTPKITTTSPPTTKLKSNIPWGEIKFWTMGMMVLSTTSGVILLDKKVI